MKELCLRGDIAAGGNGVQAKQEAAREEVTAIHTQGIWREMRGRGVFLDGTSGAGTWQPLCAKKQPHLCRRCSWGGGVRRVFKFQTHPEMLVQVP